MLKEALEWLQATTMKPTHTVELEGEEYQFFTGSNRPVRIPEEPEVATRIIKTLDGFVNYINNCDEWNTDEFLSFGFQRKDLIIGIQSPTSVSLFSLAFGPRKQQENYIAAQAILNDTKSMRFLEQEEFITRIQTDFVQDEITEAILKIVGTLRYGKATTLDDDGVTQKVTAASGIERVSDVILPNPILLRPYRTFTEIEQPRARYILRVCGGSEDELPTMSLHKVKDNLWEMRAMEGIRDYLRANLLNKDIPIIY
jgi:hypothetical protein